MKNQTVNNINRIGWSFFGLLDNAPCVSDIQNYLHIANTPTYYPINGEAKGTLPKHETLTQLKGRALGHNPVRFDLSPRLTSSNEDIIFDYSPMERNKPEAWKDNELLADHPNQDEILKVMDEWFAGSDLEVNLETVEHPLGENATYQDDMTIISVSHPEILTKDTETWSASEFEYHTNKYQGVIYHIENLRHWRPEFNPEKFKRHSREAWLKRYCEDDEKEIRRLAKKWKGTTINKRMKSRERDNAFMQALKASKA